jgi:3-hydroxyacyl-CoA dehydrogenase
MGIFKMPIGPFGMFDQLGLDTIAEILGHWAETLNDDAGRRRVEYLKAWMAQGFLGIQVEPRILSLSLSRLCGVRISERREGLLELGSAEEPRAVAFSIHPPPRLKYVP